MLDVPMRHEEASHTVFNDLGDSPVIPSHYRLAMGHGLEKNHAESFAATGEREDITRRVASHQLFLRHTGKKANAVSHGQLSRELFEPSAVVAITHCYQRKIRHGRKQVGHSRDQVVHSLVAFACSPASNCEDHPTLRESCRQMVPLVV